MPERSDLSAHQIAELLHELRTPLGGMSAMLDLLAGSGVNADQARMLAALQASMDHLSEIAARVLGGARSGAVSRCTIGELLEQVQALHGAAATSTAIELKIALSAEAAKAKVEAGPLRQVLDNLLSNAIRYQNGGVIAISARMRVDGRITFAVVDQGPGLSESEATRMIAEGGAVSGRDGGAGLGLTICRKLVTSRGGTLSGGPREDGHRGAAFRFDWPVQMALALPDAPVLVVDDHPASRLVMTTILKRLGLAAQEASGVDEALELLSRHEFRAVLTDLAMPEGGGARLIASISDLSRKPAVIVVSADRPDMPVDGFIMKPISARAIVETLTGLGLIETKRAA